MNTNNMIVTPKDKLLLEALGIVAALHERNKQQGSRFHLDLNRLPREIRELLLSLCTNSCLIDYERKPVNRVVMKTANGFDVVPYNDELFIYGLTDAGWEKYQEPAQVRSRPKQKIPTVIPVPTAPNHNIELVRESRKEDALEECDNTGGKRFKIGFSFAGEYRSTILETIGFLLDAFDEKQILYDEFHKAEFARPNLALKLQQLYHKETELNTIWLCKEYGSKSWCGIEYRALQQRLAEKDYDSLFFVRLDDAEIEGFYPDLDGCIDIKHDSPEKIAEYIKERYTLLQQNR